MFNCLFEQGYGFNAAAEAGEDLFAEAEKSTNIRLRRLSFVCQRIFCMLINKGKHIDKVKDIIVRCGNNHSYELAQLHSVLQEELDSFSVQHGEEQQHVDYLSLRVCS